MTHLRILGTCIICTFLAACEPQDYPAAVKTTTGIITAPAKTDTQKTDRQKPEGQKPAKQQKATIEVRPALKLTIDSLPVESQRNDNNFLNENGALSELNNELYEKLNNKNVHPGVNLSGKLLTNEDKLDSKEYLDSVDGLQINIKGNFD